MTIRVVIIEDKEEILNGLSLLLGKSEILDVVGSFSIGESAIREISLLKPDVALVNIGLLGVSGIDVIRKLREILPSLEMLVLTVHEDKDHLFAALKAGVSGYLLKDSTSGEIIRAIKEVYNHGSPMSSKVARYIIEYFHETGSDVCKDASLLTERENEILKGIADGLTDKRLADRLFLSPHTVRTHLKNIYDKLHVHSKVEAVMRAKKEGIV